MTTPPSSVTTGPSSTTAGPPQTRIRGPQSISSPNWRLESACWNWRSAPAASNLVTADRQLDCFRNVARVLEPGGAFVLECYVPDPREFDDGQAVKALAVTEDSATIEVYRHDAAAQCFTSQKITFTSSGIRMLPLVMRYCWPSELDLMAKLAGLTLTERYSGWDRRPFGSASTSHVSVYRR
jgi:hypothetical protein